MTEIDVICLTKTANDEIYDMCRETLKSLYDSETDISFNTNLIESADYNEEWNYFNLASAGHWGSCNHIYAKEKFNYNRFLNIGLNYLKPRSEWIVIMNNDLKFEKGWFTNIVKAYEQRPDIFSFSPFEPDFHPKYYGDTFQGDENIVEGYQVSARVCGWCIVMRKDVIREIGQFDEKFEFWYQDNDYAEVLKSKGFKHAVVRDSQVRHLREKSYDLLTPEERERFTAGAREIFMNKWYNNENN